MPNLTARDIKMHKQRWRWLRTAWDTEDINTPQNPVYLHDGWIVSSSVSRDIFCRSSQSDEWGKFTVLFRSRPRESRHEFRDSSFACLVCISCRPNLLNLRGQLQCVQECGHTSAELRRIAFEILEPVLFDWRRTRWRTSHRFPRGSAATLWESRCCRPGSTGASSCPTLPLYHFPNYIFSCLQWTLGAGFYHPVASFRLWPVMERTRLGAASRRREPAMGDLASPPRGGLRRTSYGMRRSCDACGRRKKKCDGGDPCSGCAKAGGLCRYRKRRWHLPKPQQDEQQQQRPGDQHQQQYPKRQVLTNSTSDALLACGMLPFKRCSLP